MYCECHKIYPNCGGSYVDHMIISSWLVKKKNLINKKDNKCFQYAVTLSLNQEEVKNICKEQQKFNLLKRNKSGKE